MSNTEKVSNKNADQKEVDETSGNLDDLKSEIKAEAVDKFFDDVGKSSWMGFFKKRKIASDFIGAIKEVGIKDLTGLGGLSQYLIPGVVNAEILGKGISYLAPGMTINILFKILNKLPDGKQEDFLNSVFDNVIKKNSKDEDLKPVIESFKKVNIGLLKAKTTEDLSKLKVEVSNGSESDEDTEKDEK